LLWQKRDIFKSIKQCLCLLIDHACIAKVLSV
jgi:hypothetical protein